MFFASFILISEPVAADPGFWGDLWGGFKDGLGDLLLGEDGKDDGCFGDCNKNWIEDLTTPRLEPKKGTSETQRNAERESGKNYDWSGAEDPQPPSYFLEEQYTESFIEFDASVENTHYDADITSLSVICPSCAIFTED